MSDTIARPATGSREGLTLLKLWRFLTLPFRPRLLKPWLAVARFEDVPVDRLSADGIRGVLIDADGTLCPHHSREFSESACNHIIKMQESGLRVAIFTNASEDRFDCFSGVSVVTGVPPKPDPIGFRVAMKDYLHLDDPSQVCMVGDNFITDGGAIGAGMRFIHVRPVPGAEPAIHYFSRSYACLFARLYFPNRFPK